MCSDRFPHLSMTIAVLYGFVLAILGVQCTSLTTSHRLCPVSSGVNFSSNSDHYYPYDIYFKHRIVDGKPMDAVIQCLVQTHNMTCPINFVGCPLIENNVHDGIQRAHGWKKSTSLRTLKSALQDSNATVRMFVFGGSVTGGVGTAGCSVIETKGWTQGMNRCAWPHYFEPWLKSIGKSRVELYNFGKGGTTSEYSSIRVGVYMHEVKVHQFTQNDVIIIDHSFNDYALCQPFRAKSIETGLESLIRRILSFSKSFMELPTVILLDTFLAIPNNCHSKIYAKLAEHYNLRLYSYVDAITSNHSITEQSSIYHHLIFMKKGDVHPYWHIHLFYADFISSILLHEMNHSDSIFSLDGSVVPYVLPEPLISVNDTSEMCNPAYEPLLRFSYDDIIANTTIGEFDNPSNGAWKVRLDRKGRGGIITELEVGSNISDHRKPITFRLNGTEQDVRAVMAKSNVLVQVTYLRSYENGGMVRLKLCGGDVKKATFDALWPDYTSYRYTTPVIYNVGLQEWCPKKLKYPRGIEVSFEQVLASPRRGWDNLNMTTYIKEGPRLAQLFKIVSVLVCRV